MGHSVYMGLQRNGQEYILRHSRSLSSSCPPFWLGFFPLLPPLCFRSVFAIAMFPHLTPPPLYSCTFCHDEGQADAERLGKREFQIGGTPKGCALGPESLDARMQTYANREKTRW